MYRMGITMYKKPKQSTPKRFFLAMLSFFLSSARFITCPFDCCRATPFRLTQCHSEFNKTFQLSLFVLGP